VSTLSLYVLATRDIEFLNQPVNTNFGQHTVESATWFIFSHLINVTGVGKHNLNKILFCDHNDGLYSFLSLNNAQKEEAIRTGESVMNAAMATYAYKKYSEMLGYVGKTWKQDCVESLQREQVAAVGNTWNGKWYNRAWLGNNYGWLGDTKDDTLWLEPNAWAILGGVSINQNHTDSLVKEINTRNRDVSPIGALFSSKTHLTKYHYTSFWYCGTLPLQQAFGQTGYNDLAYDEWKKSSLAYHSNIYPDYWFGTWSGCDSINSVLGPNPGSVGTPTYPVLNAWSHTTPLATIPYLVGLEFVHNGVSIKPKLSLTKYTISSYLFGIQKHNTGEYSGWYTINSNDVEELVFNFEFDKEEALKINSVFVNNKKVQLVRPSDNTITFNAKFSNKTIKWMLSTGENR